MKYLLLVLASSMLAACQPMQQKMNAGTNSIIPSPINSPTDPANTGLMVGYPLPDSLQVTQQNWLSYPINRWSFRHVRELFPTAAVEPGDSIYLLQHATAEEWDTLSFYSKTGKFMTLKEYLFAYNVDGFMVLQDGQIVYEKYAGSYSPRDYHLWMSTTKSLTGLLAEMLIYQGLLDESKTASYYLPQLAGTVYGNATIRQLLNMELNIREEASTKAAALPAESFSGPFLDLVKKGKATQLGPNGQLFFYTNSDPQTIGAIMTAITKKSWSQLVSELIWAKMGSEKEGYVIVDKHGQAMSAGGYNSTIYDVARFLEMIRHKGFYNGKQIVPADVVQRLLHSADNKEIFANGNVGPKRPGMSYKSYWYQVNDGDGSLELIGIYGQHHHINPAKKITIVQLSTHSEPGGDGKDYGYLVAAITKALAK